MRFAIAIGILANTLPAASQSENVNVLLARSERKDRMQALLQEPPSGRGALVKKLNRGKKSSLFGRQRVSANQGILKNILASQEGTVECDPASSDADVGLLSCGMGNYCMESQDSKLGGFCVESPMAFDRDLQDEPDVLPAQYCNESSPVFGDFECDCDEFDVANNTGTLSCDVEVNYCFEAYGCDDTCANANFTYSTDGESFSYTACFDFFSPYEQKFCYYITSSALGITDCEISLNNELCTSCSTSSPLDPECGQFDCENVGMGSSENSCEYSFYPPIVYDCFAGGNNITCNVCLSSDDPLFPDASLGNYTCGELDATLGEELIDVFSCAVIQLFSYDVCCNSSTPEPFLCALCGAGMDITIPDGVVSIPTQPDTTCAELEVAAAAGAISRLQCPLLQPFVTTPCGCMPTTPTPAPIEGPTAAPIEGPTAAPIDGPTAAPIDGPTPAPIEEPTPGPTDGVSSLLSSKSAMSLLGLSMVMVAYFAG
jgi:hypothetical protein